MPSEVEIKTRIKSWSASVRAAGKAVGIKELLGHSVPKVWLRRMVQCGFIELERSPWGGLYACWLVRTDEK